MPTKKNPTKEIKCSCGINTIVNVKPAKAYCELTRFVCECKQVFHIIDYMNGCTCYYAASKDVDEAYLKQVDEALIKMVEEAQQAEKIPVQKECFNHCPECNATDPNIIWGDKDYDSTQVWQNGTCKKCGCEFTEVYTYTFSEIDATVESLPHPIPDE